MSGARVPATQDKLRLTLTLAPERRSRAPVSLCLEGRALIQGREVSHASVPAEDMMQAFNFRHLVPAQDFKVVAMSRGQTSAPARIIGESFVKMPLGGTARVRFDTRSRPLPDKFQAGLSDPPAGITIQGASASAGVMEIVLQSDASTTKVGLKANLIVQVFEPGLPTLPKEMTRGTPRRVPLETLPAVALEVVAR